LLLIVIGFQLNAQHESVLIPSGVFIMGDNGTGGNWSPAHEVSLTHDFFMSKFETTNAQYAEVLNYALEQDELLLSGDTIVNNLHGDSQILIYLNLTFYITCDISFNGESFEVTDGKEDFPVVNVSWYGAAFYCNMISRLNNLEELYNLDDWSCEVYGADGYRLPTEAEWEYAASYNDDRIYPWGDFIDINYANYDEFPGNSTTEVGSFSPLGDNQLGVCDLSGNLHEWTHDWLNNYPASAQIDPINEDVYNEEFKVFRGGSWFSPSSYCVNYYRGSSQRHFTFPFLGFRIIYFDVSSAIDNAKIKTTWSELNLFPNPATHNCRIEMEGSCEYFIYNSVGNIVLEGNFKNHLDVDISTFSKGIYFVSVNSFRGNFASKLVVR